MAMPGKMANKVERIDDSPVSSYSLRSENDLKATELASF